jgi:predicted DsbA family dithiol-disulfide isomerase
MEPAWRKLLYHYGQHLSVRHLYGGLLPGWDGFRDASAGIARPADVARHWAEVTRHYGQPIDPSIWLRDPLPSSYPPSIALHAVRMLAPERESNFLRRIREALFLEARNIARPELLAEYAGAEGIDAAQFAMLFHGGIAERAFRRDLEEVGRLGVRGFPTLIISGREGQTTALHGSQPYARLEQVLLRLTGLPRVELAPTPDKALAAYGAGTTREFAELLGLEHSAAVQVLAASGAVRTPLAGDALWSAGAGGIARVTG